MNNKLSCVLEMRRNEKGYNDLVLVFPNGEEHKFYFKNNNDVKHIYGCYKSNAGE